jgi:hypothetical protein
MAEARPTARWTFALALLVIAAGAWAFYNLAAYTSRAGTTAPLHSPERFDPYGSAALEQLLRKRGQTVKRLQSPRLLRQAKGVLIQVLPLPPEGAAQNAGADRFSIPAKRLKDWIAAGNTVVQLTRRYTPLMQQLGLPTGSLNEKSARTLEAFQRRGRSPDKLSATLYHHPLRDTPAASADTNRALSLRQPRYWPQATRAPATIPATQPAVTQPAPWTPLATGPRGTVAARIDYGKGQFIAVAAPTPALNHGLKQTGNLAWMLSLIEPTTGENQTIWLDVWSLGLGHPGTIMGLVRQFHLLPAILQVILVIAVYHWAWRGRPRPARPAPPRRRATTEQLRTLGYLYQHAMPPHELARQTYETVLHRLATALRWPASEIEPRLGLTHNAHHAHQNNAAQAPPQVAEARDLLRRARELAGRFPIRCRQCGYNLTGSDTATCPECGQPIAIYQRHQLTLRPATLSGEAPPPKPREIEHQAITLLDQSHHFAQRHATNK